MEVHKTRELAVGSSCARPLFLIFFFSKRVCCLFGRFGRLFVFNEYIHKNGYLSIITDIKKWLLFANRHSSTKYWSVGTWQNAE